MKYRIKQINNYYYPQYKGMLFWRDFECPTHWASEKFHSLVAAKEFLAKKSEEPKIIIHPYP